jgi:hypothetical protein
MSLKILLHKSSYQHTEHVDLVKDAVQYAVDFFDLRKHPWRVEIYIVPTIDKNDTAIGQHVYIRQANYEYSKIYVSCAERCGVQIVQTLFHEIAHLKQVIKGQLYYPINGFALWNGRTLINLSESNVNYWNLPYEKDARFYAKILLWSYRMNKIKQKFKQITKWFKKDMSADKKDNQLRHVDLEPMSKPGDKDYEI